MDNETTEEIKRYLDVTVAGLRANFDVTIADLRADLKADIRDVRMVTDDLREEIRDVKRHADVVAESLRSEIRLVAEGVAGLDEKFTQEFVNARVEIDDVKALIRSGYAHLDRKIQERPT